MKININKNPKLINIKNANFTYVDLVFPFNFDHKENVILNVLINLINAGTDKYFKVELMHEEKKRLTSIELYYQGVLDQKELVFEMKVPKNNIIKDFDLKNALDLFKDYIYKPKIINNKFDEEEFQRCISLELNKIENEKRGFNNLVKNEYINFIDPNSDYIPSVSFRENILKNVKNEDLVKIYKKIIKQDYYLIITGDTSQKDLIQNYFNKTNNISYKINKYDLMDMKEYQEKRIKTSYDESALVLLYQYPSLSKKYLKYRPIFLELLYSGETNILFQNLRTKNGLIYYNMPFNSSLYGIYGLTCFLNKNNIEKAINITKETVNSLLDKKYLKELIEKRKMSLKHDLLYNEDKTYHKLDEKLLSISGFDTSNKRLKLYENINIDDLIYFFKQIKLTGILILEGDKNA